MDSHHQYKSNVYAINDVASATSYSEVIESEIQYHTMRLYAEFDQRYLHVVGPSSSASSSASYPNPPNYFVINRIESTNPQNQPMVVTATKNKGCTCRNCYYTILGFAILGILAGIIASIFGIWT